MVRNHKILTIDKLRRRNHFIVNGCPMCLKDEKMVHHLLIHCQCYAEHFLYELGYAKDSGRSVFSMVYGSKFVRGKI